MNKNSHSTNNISIKDIRAIAEETNKISSDVLNTISVQDDQLNRIHNNLEDTENLHQMSSWILRNMTWSGWFYNFFTRFPLFKQREIQENQEITKSPSINDIKNDIIDNKEKHINLNDNTNANTNANEYIAYNSMRFNTELYEIEKTLKNLHSSGIIIGEKLDNQNKKLEVTSIKNDTLNLSVKKSNAKITRLL